MANASDDGSQIYLGDGPKRASGRKILIKLSLPHKPGSERSGPGSEEEHMSVVLLVESWLAICPPAGHVVRGSTRSFSAAFATVGGEGR